MADTAHGPHDRALELEREGLELEDAIHRSMADEQQLYDAMRERFEARLASADIGATYVRVIRHRMVQRAARRQAERAGAT